MQNRAVILTGPLTDEDIKFLAQAMRTVEQRRPDETFILEICDNEASMDQARETLRKTFPKLPDKKVYEGIVENGEIRDTGEYD